MSIGIVMVQANIHKKKRKCIVTLRSCSRNKNLALADTMMEKRKKITKEETKNITLY